MLISLAILLAIRDYTDNFLGIKLKINVQTYYNKMRN